MPSRLKRYQQAGGAHFLTFSCYGRLPYLIHPAACELFLRSLEQTRRGYAFHVFGYALMPEHVHLLVDEPRSGSLSCALQALKTSVSKQSAQRPFWLPRYYDFNVHGQRAMSQKLRYMHRNPVARGLVARPEDWPWSSYRHHLTGEEGIVEVESHWTAARRMGLVIPESPVL